MAVTDRNVGMARILALFLPVALLAGAYSFQYLGGLYPCEMCWWQRYPHIFAILPAAAAFFAGQPAQRVLTIIAALSILASGLIGFYHAGVEYGIFQGVTSCTVIASGSPEDFVKSLLEAPLVRCDVAPWTLFGVSLAGFNFLISTAGALAILLMLKGTKKNA